MPRRGDLQETIGVQFSQGRGDPTITPDEHPFSVPRETMTNDPQKPIDLSEHAWEIRVHPLTMDDFDDLVAMQLRCFPGMEPWQRDQVESQLKIFPEGQLCV